MVGAIPIVGSSRIIDSLPACSRISVEALSSSCVKNGIDNSRSLMGRKQSKNVSCLYGGRGGVRVGVMGRSCSRRRKKGRGLVVVSELAGQYEDSFEDVKTVLMFEPASISKLATLQDTVKMGTTTSTIIVETLRLVMGKP
ncbi:hypothetical protein Droror1_Dr00016249 [Drosera rotundifolia]